MDCYKVKNSYKKAQFALEYALLIAVAVGSLLAMGLYLQRAVQGQLKEKGEQLGHEYFTEGLMFRTVTSTSRKTIEEQNFIDREGERAEEGSSSRKEHMTWINYTPD